jgi:hypothetical protein
LELLAIGALTRDAVYELGGDGPMVRGAELAQLGELVYGILPFVFGGNSRVKSGAGAFPHPILFQKHLFCQQKMPAPQAFVCSADERGFWGGL